MFQVGFSDAVTSRHLFLNSETPLRQRISIMDMWIQGLLAVFEGQNLLFLLLGTGYGLLIGALPGLGPSFGVASMLPLTFILPPSTAIIFLASIHASTAYGDSIASILINTPGGAGSVASCWDGYPLARQGKAGFALGIATAGSTMGGIIGWLCLMLVSPILMTVALMIGPPEYAMLALLALSLISVASKGATLKGLILGGVGLLLSFVGFDPTSGFIRFSFGTLYLRDGIGIIPVTLGLFALSQAIVLSTEKSERIVETFSPSDRVLDGFYHAFGYPGTVLRAGLIGIFLGVMPALGISTANIVAYLSEKKASKTPETFGRGNPRGLLAPEVAKNACVVGDLVPTFTLGIPGSTTTALFLAALMLQGIAPGPDFFQKGAFSYTVFMGILMAQLAFCLIGLMTARYFSRVVYVQKAILVPCIVVLSFVGAYGINNELIDILVTIIFGIVGYLLNKYGFPVVCIVLGLVLGKMFESNFHRSLIIGYGQPTIFFKRPISLSILILIVAFLTWPYIASASKGLFSHLIQRGKRKMNQPLP